MFRDQIGCRQPKLLPLSKPLGSKVCIKSLALFQQVVKMGSAAVRKNRYVILPVDFEEAWKVRYLAVLGVHHYKP